MFLTRVLAIVLSVCYLAVSLPVDDDEIKSGEILHDLQKTNQSLNDFNLSQSINDFFSNQSVNDVKSNQTILNLEYPENVTKNYIKEAREKGILTRYFEDIINAEIDDIITPIYPSQSEIRPVEIDAISEVKADTTYYDLYNDDGDGEIEDDQIDVGEILTASENGVVFTPSLIFKRKQALKRKRRRNQTMNSFQSSAKPNSAITSQPYKPTKPVKTTKPTEPVKFVKPVYVYYYYPYSSSYYRRYSYGDFGETNGAGYYI